MAAHPWRNNAELIADCARLGYLKPTDMVFDATFGNGNWWSSWMPDDLIWRGPHDTPFDFTKMDYLDNEFDVITFDPPYMSSGGRSTTTIPHFHAAYGMTAAPNSPLGVQGLINAGLAECRRVVKPNGIVLVKCMNYISSGKLWLGAYYTLNWALRLDFEVIDWFEMIRSSSPQSQTRQVHARRNLSTLYVLKKRVCSSCGSWGHYGEQCVLITEEENDRFEGVLDL